MTAVSYKKVLLDKRELTGFLVKEVKALPDRLTGLRNHCNLDKNHGILLKGKTTDFTDTCWVFPGSVHPSSFRLFPSITLAAIFAS